MHKSPGQALIDVQGVGYDVLTTVSVYDRLPGVGQEVLLYISESMAMYGGGLTLYGFLTLEEKEIYMLLKEVPGTGSRKALDYLDKISKSSPDFRRAILEGDARSLVSLFGFTKKTADKMVVALKDRLAGLRVSGKEKWTSSMPSTGFKRSDRRPGAAGISRSRKRARLSSGCRRTRARKIPSPRW